MTNQYFLSLKPYFLSFFSIKLTRINDEFHSNPTKGALNGTCVVVKNHNTRHLSEAKGVLLLIRNPYDAILAEFNRIQGKSSKSEGSKHTASANHAVFNTTKWFDRSRQLGKRWVDLHEKYIKFATNQNVPMYIFFYEDLKTNATQEMSKVLEFLDKNFHFYPTDAERRLRCLKKLEEINASFKRKKVPFGWEIFPKDQIKMIDNFITKTRSSYVKNGFPDFPDYYRNSTNSDHKIL